MTMQAGSVLGVYEIAFMLGKGGMGEAWRARDTKLDRVSRPAIGRSNPR